MSLVQFARMNFDALKGVNHVQIQIVPCSFLCALQNTKQYKVHHFLYKILVRPKEQTMYKFVCQI